ncbi:MAG: DUF503 domain-containing protein [Deltaproteobacteria bacterium]|nr:DUF503 domain-containing protein [Deltaproteobacteria bacterium]
MVVGVLELTLSIVEADSLKAKRRVVKSVVERIRHRFGVAIAEVDFNDEHRRACLGIAMVANDQAYVNSVLDKVRSAVADYTLGQADLQDERLELLHF